MTSQLWISCWHLFSLICFILPIGWCFSILSHIAWTKNCDNIFTARFQFLLHTSFIQIYITKVLIMQLFVMLIRLVSWFCVIYHPFPIMILIDIFNVHSRYMTRHSEICHFIFHIFITYHVPIMFFMLIDIIDIHSRWTTRNAVYLLYCLQIYYLILSTHYDFWFLWMFFKYILVTQFELPYIYHIVYIFIIFHFP